MQLSTFIGSPRLAWIDETHCKSAVEMIPKRQAEFLARKSHLWKLV